MQQVTEIKPKEGTLIEVESPRSQNLSIIKNENIQKSQRSPQQGFQFPKRNFQPQMPKAQNRQKFIPQLPSVPPNIQTPINLGKITKILSDPAVLGVECPGAGKNIVANRSGTIQVTAITLSKEEINSIIQEISEKTRIPIMSGIFKSSINDLVITAVVSEFVGTRFVIQKRTPFMRH